jgi:regulatory protein RepA
MASSGDRYARLNNLFPFTPMDPADTEYRMEWLVKGFVMEGKINVFFGAEKAGKSRLMSQLLAAMYSGSAFLGFPTRSPGRTLYLAGEETRQEITARLVAAATQMGVPKGTIDWEEQLVFCEAAGMRLDQVLQRQWLRDMLQGGEFRSLIVDPLRRVHGASESSNDEMAPICNDLREWTNRFGLTLLLIHHTGKLSMDDDVTRIATWSRGATDLPAVLDWALYLERQEGRVEDRIRLLRKGRAPKEGNMILADRGTHFDRVAMDTS